MKKDKLILKNGTIVELEIGASLNNIGVVFKNKESMISVWNEFTEDNLKTVQVKNCDDITVGTYSDLVLESETSVVKKDGSVHTSFILKEKGVEKYLDTMEETQDAGISDLEPVPDIMEGDME